MGVEALVSNIYSKNLTMAVITSVMMVVTTTVVVAAPIVVVLLVIISYGGSEKTCTNHACSCHTWIDRLNGVPVSVVCGGAACETDSYES